MAAGAAVTASAGPRSVLAEDRGPDLGKMLLDVPGDVAISLRGRLDAERGEQLCRRDTRIAAAAEDRMQALIGQMVKHEVDDAPRVVSLVVVLVVVLLLLFLLVLLYIGLVHQAPPADDQRADGRSGQT